MINLNNCPTVADTKRAFYKGFPYVIAPSHRTVLNELLVELFLLSPQTDIGSDPLFAVGLIQFFGVLTKHYQPQNHRMLLFEALCNSIGFDSFNLRQIRKESLSELSQYNIEELHSWSLTGADNSEILFTKTFIPIKRRFHYSRLMAIGLLCLIKRARGVETLEAKELYYLTHNLAEKMGFIRERIDRDLSVYIDTIEKMAAIIDMIPKITKKD
uniref:Protein Thf1 n=1 Tax=Paulinella chromatophora TaxID=39717 RepID=B1X3V9_PAUCH|nr:hypothetical protein PCC_0178 [Paulinella chromatophora]ACB42628.1 hypothetical protein PCC_0178 [Paulinella chromatophora]